VKSIIIAAIVAALVSATAATAASGLITGAQIKNGSIGLVDLSANAKRALKGQRGPAGPAGLQGLQGVAGGFDPAKVTYVTGPTSTFGPGATGSVRATCPAGTKVLGGGYFANIMHVAGSQTFDGQSWNVIIGNNYSISVDANAFAVCGAR
jgi:hypothetical protein